MGRGERGVFWTLDLKSSTQTPHPAPPDFTKQTLGSGLTLTTCQPTQEAAVDIGSSISFPLSFLDFQGLPHVLRSRPAGKDLSALDREL